MSIVYKKLESLLEHNNSEEVKIIEFLNIKGDNKSNYTPEGKKLSIVTYEHSNLVGREIARCDIMICGNGRMVYEGATLQKKIVAIPQNSRESTHNFVKLLPGSHMMDIWNEVSLESIAELLVECIDELANESVKSKMLKKAISKDIADGAARVWNEIRELLE